MKGRFNHFKVLRWCTKTKFETGQNNVSKLVSNSKSGNVYSFITVKFEFTDRIVSS